MLFVIILIVELAIGYFISSGILYAASKFIELKGVDFKKSLIIAFLSTIISFLLNIILGLFLPLLLSSILLLVLYFISFHYLLNYFYKNTWVESLQVCLLYGLGLAILGIIAIFIRGSLPT